MKPDSPGPPGLWCIRRARFANGRLPTVMVAYDLWDRDGYWQGTYDTWEESMADSKTREDA